MIEEGKKTLTPPAPLVRGETAPACSTSTREAKAGRTNRDETGFAPPLSRGGREGLKRPCLAYEPKLTALARTNRKNPTPAETLLWHRVLRHKQFEDYKFHRQKPIGPYIVDFYCTELHLIIEIDGDSHASQVEYDLKRTQYLNSLDLHVVRYTNRDVLQNLAGVFDDLTNHLNGKH